MSEFKWIPIKYDKNGVIVSQVPEDGQKVLVSGYGGVDAEVVKRR